MGKFIDRVGQRFGRLVVLKRAENKGCKVCWLCKCDCGRLHYVAAGNLVSGEIRSCGCLLKVNGQHLRKHGEAHKTKEYRAWRHMIDRCCNPKDKAYKNYGGRGITVCNKWRSSYVAFLGDMGRAPNSEYTIDREDNNGDYNVENCRWVTRAKQNRNKRNNVWFDKEKTLCQNDFAKIVGVTTSVIVQHKRYGRSIPQIIQYYKEKSSVLEKRSMGI